MLHTKRQWPHRRGIVSCRLDFYRFGIDGNRLSLLQRCCRRRRRHIRLIVPSHTITVDRKYMSAWTGQLSVRFLVISNELPRLSDASCALVSRFIVLVLTQSFYGHEDQTLTARLLTELPGILNWTIAGWRRLTERGHFWQPGSALDAVQQLEDLGSPIGAFLRERCVIAAGHSVGVGRLFDA